MTMCRPLTRYVPVLVLGEAVCVCVRILYLPLGFAVKLQLIKENKVYFLENRERPGCPSQAPCSKNTDYHSPGGDEASAHVTC